MPSVQNLALFLENSSPLLDVRSPNEYLHGHIPESLSFPLFNDAERAKIGKIYKKNSEEEAIELGLFFAQTKLESFLNEACSLLVSHEGKIVCWRGGMRSGFVAHLLEACGFKICTLQGGYKAYRNWALQTLEQKFVFNIPLFFVLGGLTGSGKTEILKELKNLGEQVIDLEKLANHQGSAFGGINQPEQPTQEQFENELAFVMKKLDRSKPVWIEDESRLIGRCHIPASLYQKMLHAAVFYIQCPLSSRLNHLLNRYGKAPKQFLLHATQRITKRLGSQLSREIQILLEEDKNDQALEKLLTYYDKAYQYQLSKRKVVYSLIENNLSSLEWATALQTFYRQKLI